MYFSREIWKMLSSLDAGIIYSENQEFFFFHRAHEPGIWHGIWTTTTEN